MTIKIEVIHDLVCSWCAIGLHHLKGAIQELPDTVEVEWNFIPHELNPWMGEAGMPIELYFTEHHRWSETRYKAYRKKLQNVIDEHQIGIDFNYRTHYYNTNLVHRILTAAEMVGVHHQTHQCLLEAYHLKGINLSEIDLVRSVLINANLDAQGLLDSALHNPSVLAVMAEKVRRKAMFPVQSVPAFVFNDTDFVPGSNSKAFFKAHIETNYLGQSENVDQIATV